MIKKITQDTELNTFERIVDIHRACISQSNTSIHTLEDISKWQSEINIEDTKKQLDYTTWVTLEKNNSVVGFAQYSLPDGELYQIQIDPKIQRSGYGKELYEYVEEDFRKNDLEEVCLYSVVNAIKFYESLGFEKREQSAELTVMTKGLR